MFQTQGIIEYKNSDVPARRYILAYLDDEIGKYYRSLLPKAWYIKPPKRKTHVSIVRYFEFESCDNNEWEKYKGQIINVEYYSGIQTDGLYFWLNCVSKDIGRIRKELGLSVYRNVDSRFKLYDCYHITIGNLK